LDAYIKAFQSAGLDVRRVIGPYDSPVNFAPYSTEDVWGLCAGPFVRILGWKLARRLCGPRTLAGRAAMVVGGRRLSRKDRRPGRLYSFLAAKAG